MHSTECRGVQGDLVPFSPTALVRLSPMHDARDPGADICFAARGHRAPSPWLPLFCCICVVCRIRGSDWAPRSAGGTAGSHPRDSTAWPGAALHAKLEGRPARLAAASPAMLLRVQPPMVTMHLTHVGLLFGSPPVRPPSTYRHQVHAL